MNSTDVSVLSQATSRDVEGTVHSGVPPELAATLERIRPYTMVPLTSLVELAYQVRATLMYDTPGAFVECGVWRGGSSFLIADLLRERGARDRKVWLFDSFEGIPEPEKIDGPAAEQWAKDTEGAWYFDNLRVSLDDVQASAQKLGLAGYTEFVKGWFDDTLPANRERVGPIALLRIDCDWYASVKCCLDNLYDQVVDGGIIIFDDYYTYDGCAAAVHEFLGKHKSSDRIETVFGRDAGYQWLQAACIRKGKTNWQWARQMYFAVEEIRQFVPAGEQFVLIDQEEWGLANVVDGRRRRHFMERDGEPWGNPSDGDMAVRELERLAREGARIVVIGWPSFWVLDHYPEMKRYLTDQADCLAANERIRAYALRNPAAR